MANILDERGQNKVYNGYYADLQKQNDAKLNYIQKEYDAKVAMDAKYQQYLQREGIGANKASTGDSYRRELAQDALYRRDELSQNRAYNGYYGNIDKQNNSDAQRDVRQSQAYQKQQRLNDDANDKFMVAREKRYQSEMALDTKQAMLYDANQRKQYQSHIDSIVKRENADKLSYDQYLNRLANKYNAEGKANDVANNKYIANLARQDAREAQISAQYQAKTTPQSYQGYVRQIQAAKVHAEEMHQVMLRTNSAQDKLNFATARTGLQSAVRASEAFNASIGIGGDRVGQLNAFMTKFQSHARWIMAGAAIGALVAIPTGALQTLKEVELGMAGIQQVLPQLHADLAKVTKGSEEYLRSFFHCTNSDSKL